MELINNVTDCALVFEGGGYRASYTAGLARVLLEQGIYFDYVCGISAGASHTVDYVSRDLRRTRLAFLGHNANGQRCGGVVPLLRGQGYFNADWLYEGAIEDGTLPFDWETFMANPARVRLQAFERDTGRTVLFGKEDMASVTDAVNIARASSTLPGVMHPKPLGGRVFYDGGLGVGAGIPLHMAERDGYTKFLFVATRMRGYRKTEPNDRERAVLLGAAGNHPHLRAALLTRWKRYNEELDRVEALAEAGRCLIIYPEEMPVSSTTLDTTRLLSAYEKGHAQAMRDLPRIREFLFGSADGGPHRDPAEVAADIMRADNVDDGYVLYPPVL